MSMTFDQLVTIRKQYGTHAAQHSENSGYTLEMAHHVWGDQLPNDASNEQWADWWVKHQIKTIELKVSVYADDSDPAYGHAADAFAGNMPWGDRFQPVLELVRNHKDIDKFKDLGEWGNNFYDMIFEELPE